VNNKSRRVIICNKLLSHYILNNFRLLPPSEFRRELGNMARKIKVKPEELSEVLEGVVLELVTDMFKEPTFRVEPVPHKNEEERPPRIVPA